MPRNGKRNHKYTDRTLSSFLSWLSNAIHQSLKPNCYSVYSVNKYIILHRRHWLLFLLTAIGLYLFPLFIYTGDLKYFIFDNINGNHLPLLAKSGLLFAESHKTIPMIFNGLPRGAFGSEFDIQVWLYYWLDTLQAYIVNEFTIHIAAFIAMYVFLWRFLLADESESIRFFSASTGAFYFAITPFLPTLGLSIAIMPLVAFAYIRIWQRQNGWIEWSILCLFPFYSSFAQVYVFFLFTAVTIALFGMLRHRVIHFRLLFALLLVIVIFLCKDYRLVLQMIFDSGFVSHRVEFAKFDKTFMDAYRMAHLQFLHGLSHAKGMHFELLLPAAIFALLLSLLKQKLTPLFSLILFSVFIFLVLVDFWSFILAQKYSLPLFFIFVVSVFKFQHDKYGKWLSIILMLLVGLSYWLGFSFYEKWNEITKELLLVRMFDFSRFFFFSQVLWAIAAALVAIIIMRKVQFALLILLLFVIFQFAVGREKAYFGMEKEPYLFSYNAYFAASQFQQIEDYIGRAQCSYRVLSLGIDPIVALHNGFYTLDGYMVNYPLQYKHEFRKIIQRHLEKNDEARKLFDNWGNKVYLYDNGVTYDYLNEEMLRNNNALVYKDLDMNTTQISRMGGQYLFSSRRILEAQKIGLRYLTTFEDKQSVWTVHLYAIIGNEP